MITYLAGIGTCLFIVLAVHMVGVQILKLRYPEGDR